MNKQIARMADLPPRLLAPNHHNDNEEGRKRHQVRVFILFYSTTDTDLQINRLLVP